MTVECKSCSAKWDRTWNKPPKLLRASDDGKGKELVGERHPNSFWLSLVPLDEETKNKTSELVNSYLPKCPICKSEVGYEIGLNIDSPYYIRLECKSCGAVLTSGDWDEEEGEEHLLQFSSAAKGGKGATLLKQIHSIRFWQRMKLEELETPDDIQREQRWLTRKIKEIGVNLPATGMPSDLIWRFFDPIGALAIRGLPSDPFSGVRALNQRWSMLELEMEARAEERAEKYEKIVLKTRVNCPNCSKEITKDFKVCPYCGSKLNICPCCGKEIQPDFKICPYCGVRLE